MGTFCPHTPLLIGFQMDPFFEFFNIFQFEVQTLLIAKYKSFIIY